MTVSSWRRTKPHPPGPGLLTHAPSVISVTSFTLHSPIVRFSVPFRGGSRRPALVFAHLVMRAPRPGWGRILILLTDNLLFCRVLGPKYFFLDDLPEAFVDCVTYVLFDRYIYVLRD
jgi:hypothetical protein